MKNRRLLLLGGFIFTFIFTTQIVLASTSADYSVSSSGASIDRLGARGLAYAINAENVTPELQEGETSITGASVNITNSSGGSVYAHTTSEVNSNGSVEDLFPGLYFLEVLFVGNLGLIYAPPVQEVRISNSNANRVHPGALQAQQQNNSGSKNNDYNIDGVSSIPEKENYWWNKKQTPDGSKESIGNVIYNTSNVTQVNGVVSKLDVNSDDNQNVKFVSNMRGTVSLKEITVWRPLIESNKSKVLGSSMGKQTNPDNKDEFVFYSRGRMYVQDNLELYEVITRKVDGKAYSLDKNADNKYSTSIDLNTYGKKGDIPKGATFESLNSGGNIIKRILYSPGVNDSGELEETSNDESKNIIEELVDNVIQIYTEENADKDEDEKLENPSREEVLANILEIMKNISEQEETEEEYPKDAGVEEQIEYMLRTGRREDGTKIDFDYSKININEALLGN